MLGPGSKSNKMSLFQITILIITAGAVLYLAYFVDLAGFLYPPRYSTIQVMPYRPLAFMSMSLYVAISVYLVKLAVSRDG